MTWEDGFKCIVPTAVFTAPMLYCNALFVLNIQLWKNMANYGYTVMKSFTPLGDGWDYTRVEESD